MLARDCDCHCAHCRTIQARLWFAAIRDGRTCCRSRRGADPQAQARCHHAVRCPDGHGWRAVPILHRLPATVLRFGLEYAVNSIAMPMIGGTTSWGRPADRAVLLGQLQQELTVRIPGGQPSLSSACCCGVSYHRGRNASSGYGSACFGSDRPWPHSSSRGRLSKRFGGFVALDGDRSFRGGRLSGSA